MELISSVGRRQGRNSQNRVADQETVRSLLNQIAPAQGGAGGTLVGQLIEGICGDGLFEAILRFQRMHLGGQADGHVDPHGRTFQMLNQMAQAARSTRHQPIQGAQRMPGALGDGGTVLGDSGSRGRAAWASFRTEISNGLRGNPNLEAIQNYLDGLERTSAASVIPSVSEFVAFGRATMNSSGTEQLHRARVLERGTRFGTYDEQNAVILMPSTGPSNAGGFIQLAPHTLFVVLGRHSFQNQRRQGAEDTVLYNGRLRSHLGQLSGRR